MTHDELIACISELKARLANNQAGIGDGSVRDALDAARAELREIALALNDARTHNTMTIAEVCGALKAERDAALKDAERYRWLRAHAKERNVWQPIDAPERFDAAIDAARAATGGKE